MIDIQRCFREAFEVYQRNVVALVIAAALFEVLGCFSLLILAGPLAGGYSLLTLRAIRSPDRRAELSDLFSAFQQFLPLLGLFLLTLIPILIGVLLLVVPGILLATIWSFIFLLVVDRQERVFDALGGSYQLVRRGGFANCLLLTVIDIILQLAPSAIPYVGFIAAWFTAPIGWLIISSAYAQIIEAEKLPLSAGEIQQAS